jgi:hypothetical protein
MEQAYSIEIEHGGFRLVRDQEYMLWSIKTVDGPEVPVPLMSKFTALELAKDYVDRYNENRNHTLKR